MGTDNKQGLMAHDRTFTLAHLRSKVDLYRRWVAAGVEGAQAQLTAYEAALAAIEGLDAAS